MSLKNGLLIVTCLSKLQQSLSLANKKVLQNLYIHYHPQEPLLYENLSKVSSNSRPPFRDMMSIITDKRNNFIVTTDNLQDLHEQHRNMRQC